MPLAKSTVLATFPPGSFLENITSTGPTGGYLVTLANVQQLYYIPPGPGPGLGPVAPFLLETYDRDQWPFGIIPAPGLPNVFYLVTSDFPGTGSHTAHLRVLTTGDPNTGPRSRSILRFPAEATGLNGLCALSESVLLVADSFGARIWRVDLDLDRDRDAAMSPPATASASVWTSGPLFEGVLRLPDFQPGVNGLKYSARTGCVYFTNTQRRVFCRQRVDGDLDAAGGPEVLADGFLGDDLIIDEEYEGGPVAYVTTHRDNTVLRIPLGLGGVEATRAEVEVVVQGSLENDACLGPTSGAWEAGKEGRVAVFAFDGGLKGRPADGVVRPGTLVRVEF